MIRVLAWFCGLEWFVISFWYGYWNIFWFAVGALAILYGELVIKIIRNRLKNEEKP